MTQEGTTPPQYNICPLRPQVEEQEGNEPPPAVEKRVPRRETKIEYPDTLTELVNTLVVVLGRNAANVALVVPQGIPPANVEGKEAITPQEDRDNKARTDTSSRRRHARHRVKMLLR